MARKGKCVCVCVQGHCWGSILTHHSLALMGSAMTGAVSGAGKTQCPFCEIFAFLLRTLGGLQESPTDRMFDQHTLSKNLLEVSGAQSSSLHTAQLGSSTCFGDWSSSWATAVAKMALLLPGLSCRERDSPVTSCTPRSVIVTFSSRTVTVFSAKMASERGDRIWREKLELATAFCTAPCKIINVTQIRDADGNGRNFLQQTLLKYDLKVTFCNSSAATGAF